MRIRAPSSLASEWPLVRVERQQGPDREELLSPVRGDAHLAFDDGHPRTFLHLVIAERLARVEADHHRACRVRGVQDERISCPSGRVELRQPPRLHGLNLPARR
jgi:hypothetical protein